MAFKGAKQGSLHFNHPKPSQRSFHHVTVSSLFELAIGLNGQLVEYPRFPVVDNLIDDPIDWRD